MRRPIIGVMGGARVDSEVERTAFELGRAIAARGWILLNGGRNAGVMAASARGAKQAGGMTVGILPDRDAGGAAPDVDVAVVTGLGDARNVINVLSSDVVIGLPGGAGTLSEIALALKSARRVILLRFPAPAVLGAYRETGQLTDAATVEEAVSQAAEAIAGS